MISRLSAITVLILLITSAIGQPILANGPENVIVVVNSASPDSMAVANHFIHLRNIPRQNVIYLNIENKQEQVKHTYFENRILKPVLEQLKERNLGHINCITYSSDFPTVINIPPLRQAFIEKIDDDKGKVFKAFGSINSLTYFARSYLATDPSLMLLDANWYMSHSTDTLLQRPFLGNLQERYEKAFDAYAKTDYKTAISEFEEMAELHPAQVAVRYNLARAYAKNDQPEEAIQSLLNAVRVGWCYRSYTKDDPAFESLRENQDFVQLVEKIDDLPFTNLPTRGFRSDFAWGPNGWPNSSLDQGKPLMLSTVLAVTRNRGTSLQDALDGLTRSAAADSTFPDGTFYFCQTNDVRTRKRMGQFASTIEELRTLGMKAEVFQGNMPKLKDDVLGVSIGAAKYKWSDSGSQLVPGAIGENLTSYGGVMRTKNASQTTLAEMIRAGSAGSSGTVCEPYAIAKKFPHSRIHAHYVRGCTLAEAFYQSVWGPYQLLIVGDPLCRPWAKPPRFAVGGIENGEAVSGDVTVNVKIAQDSPRIGRWELFMDGLRIAQSTQPGGAFNLKSTDYSDGYHELRIVAFDATPIQTSESIAIDLMIDNDNHSVSIESSTDSLRLTETVDIRCSSNIGDKILVVHNSRVIGEIKGNSGTIKVPGVEFGAGKIRLFAEVHQDDQVISSRPLNLEIQ